MTLADTGWWDSLKAQVNTGYGYIAAKNDPAAYGVAAAQWVRVLALRDTNGVLLPRYDAAYFPGQPDQAAHNLGDDVAAILNGGMRAVMIDELSSATQELIARTCSYISYLGNYSHRWGVYVVNGPAVDYANLDNGGVYPRSAITQLLLVNAQIAVELYAYYKPVTGNATSQNYNYCSKGKDPWLQTFLVGGSNSYGIAPNRLGWLWSRRAALGSSSIIRPIFGVSDQPVATAYLSGPNPGAFLDRMFYVFVHTAYAGLAHYTNDGGAGSWTWSADKVSTTTRDGIFADAYSWYCKPPYNTASRLGSVPC